MKNRLIRISPSILCIDYNDDIVLKLALDKIEQSGAHMVHLDVMDGKFVPNKTFDHNLVDKIKDMTSLMLDVHLMIENPHDKISDYAKAGYSYLKFVFPTLLWQGALTLVITGILSVLFYAIWQVEEVETEEQKRIKKLQANKKQVKKANKK